MQILMKLLLDHTNALVNIRSDRRSRSRDSRDRGSDPRIFLELSTGKYHINYALPPADRPLAKRTLNTV